ncbi:hypothetical protein ACFLYL_00220 [Chloroflexota bacterium]
MKHSKIFRVLASMVILILLVIAIPAVPAQAATLYVTPQSGSPGTVVTVTGAGFGPNLALRITFQGMEIQDAITTSSGAIYSGTSFTVPTGYANGAYAVSFLSFGSISYPDSIGTPVGVSAIFTVTNSTGSTGGTGTTGNVDIRISPNDGPVDTEIEIRGYDFGANEDITVEFDGDELDIDGTSDTDSNGDFTKCYVIIPESTAGDHDITVRGYDSDIEATEVFTVEPEIKIYPAKGSPKSNIEVKGSGFGRRAKINIYFGSSSTAVLNNYEATTYGGFLVIIPVPDAPSGAHVVRAEDRNGNIGTSEYIVEVLANADLSKLEGGIGTKTTLSGVGFNASTSVTIKYDGEEKAKTTTNGTV